MILGLLLGTNSSDMVKSGKALVTIFEQERKFSSPAPLVSINQKTPGNHYILAFSGFKRYVFFYFIIQRCLEAHCVQVNAHSLGKKLAMVLLLVQSKIPWLQQLLLIAASGALAFPVGYLGMGISLQLFNDYKEVTNKKIITKELVCLQGFRIMY